MRAKADREPDAEDRNELVLDADEAAKAWRCPRAGCKPDAKALDDEHRGTLDAVERLTGHRFSTCPLARAWEPWVHRVVEAEEHGLANDRAAYGPPPQALVSAVRILRKSKRERDAEEARVAREERERSKQ